MEKRKISSLKGIGEKTEKLFQKIGVDTVEDLIRYYPKGFEIFEDPISVGEVEEGKVCTVAGMVFGRIQVSTNSKMQITTLHLKDVTGTLKVIWYRMPFLRNTLAKGGTLVLRGRIVRKKNEIVMEHPEIFYPSSKYEEKRDTMQPVYSLTAGLTNNSVIKAVKQALSFLDDEQDILPEELRLKYSFPKYEEAIYAMHFPREKEDFVRARKRFVFEEFLLFILSLRRMKESENRSENPFHFADRPEIEQFLGALPYHLTNAQEKVWTEIKSDMQSENVMSRLVQGDVGSGKTIIAFLALLLSALNGYQGALMAPTEVLAVQHYENISEMLEKYKIPLQAELLTGSMTMSQKKKAFIISFKIGVCSVCSQSKNCNSNTICFFLRAFFLSLFCLYIFRLAIAAVIAVSMLFPAISSKYSQCFLQYVTAARSHTLSIPVIFLTKEDADETSSTSLSISAEYVKNGTLYFSASETTAGSSFFRSILTSASI